MNFDVFFSKLFNRDAEQLESWMTPREALIRSEEVGGSPEGADKLVKTHENIEKSIKQQVYSVLSGLGCIYKHLLVLS